MMNILSLGAGVQSTTLALMAERGDIGPKPDCAIFADTCAEPKKVYDHLTWLRSQLSFQVHIVSAGNIVDDMTNGKTNGRPPFHILNPNGTKGFSNRQCTQDYKIIPIQKKVRELIGLKPRQRGPKTVNVVQWIGISIDEAARMKPSRLPYVEHRWPLIELRMSRRDCLKWMEERQYPMPPKSACTFCPFHSDAMWRDMKVNDPASWAEAVTFDSLIRDNRVLLRGTPFIHASLKPLAEVDLSTAEDRGQLNFFINECEGMCGV
ncbi:hypothetical protein NL154_05605 [Rhizobium sp. YTUHZ044]|uniref:hypothetical protein n=1 Tax=Rhizobium sp. YTUHZ044 TaxID=2962678 RepID=UPI003DAA0E4F